MVITGCTGGPTVTVNTPKAGSAPPKEVEDTKTTNTLGQAAQAGTE